MTHDELERALIEAVEREYTARLTGAQQLQQRAMDEIRALRTLMQANKTTARETQNQGGASENP